MTVRGERRRASHTSRAQEDERLCRGTPTPTTREMILSLRNEAQALELVVCRLQRKQEDALVHYTGPWKRRAYEQCEARAAAVHENKKLRRAMAECRELAGRLLHVLQEPTPHTQILGSVEDNEWRLNLLGHHPRRRHLNADRIMDHLYRKLPGWAIRSGLVEGSHTNHSSRCDNREHNDEPIHLEVNVCRPVQGHYVDVASAVWRYIVREDLDTGAAASVRVETSEILGDGIRHNTTGFRMIVDGDVVQHSTHQLCRRIDEDARIVILWKAVMEDMNNSHHRFTENADGWISFEKAVDPNDDRECCLVKCSSMALVLPLGQVGYGSGAYLRRLVQTMQLPFDESTVDRDEHARRVFADFLLATLWRHVSHMERLATDAFQSP